MNVDLFDFDLPEQLIAQTPLADRTASRLLLLNKQNGQLQDQTFKDIVNELHEGDVLVLNDTKVLPARLFGSREATGAKIEFLLLKQTEGDSWEVLAKPAKRVKQGTVIHFGEKADGSPLLKAIVEEELEMGSRIVRFEYDGIFNELLDQLGEMPLPPYIKEKLPEKERYQTVFSKHEGSAAAPTAGLHFTTELLEQLQQKGVQLAFITLHVGLGTFRPMSSETVEEHEMHAEYYEITQETADILNNAKRDSKRIVAVGTTSCRTLETIAQRFSTNRIEACNGWTSIFIFPGYEFKLVNALITNFHLPKSTLVMLVSALATRDYVLAAYHYAIEENYRFFSFGDAMFIY